MQADTWDYLMLNASWYLGLSHAECKLIFGTISCWMQADTWDYLMLNASWYLGLPRDYMPNFANTLPSGGIHLAALGTYLSRSCAVLAKRLIIIQTVAVFHVFSERSCACVELIERKMEIDQWMSPRLQKDFVDVPYWKFEHHRNVLNFCLSFELEQS